MRYALVLLALVSLITDVSAQRGPRGPRARKQARNAVYTDAAVVGSTVLVTEAPPVIPSTPAPAITATVQGVEDAMPEVNAARAALGLSPLAVDPLLCKAAYECARQRAARYIHGHLPESDFSYVKGTSATVGGCGALEDSWGWGTCAYRDTQYTVAGAAWVRGQDGLRYMHFFAR